MPSESLGELVDRLIITHIKIWWCVDVLLNGANETLLAQAGKRAQVLNSQRVEIKNRISTDYGAALAEEIEVKIESSV